jgi:glucose 1-dehydrogenase
MQPTSAPTRLLAGQRGIQRDASFGEMTLVQGQQVIDVNLTGQFVCAQG